MSACISDRWADFGSFLFFVASGALYVKFAARVLREARLQAQDTSIFDGSPVLALIGLHRTLQIWRKYSGISERDRELLQRTRGRLARLSLFGGALIGMPLWLLFVSQTCTFQAVWRG
jgi:hypothetical protein